jgi:hypothetical protein
MSWIPGWESIQATGWWSGFFFWASIVSLIGLGISEVASHRFGERKDELVEIQQIAEKDRHDQDIARVQHDAALAIERAATSEKEAAKANEAAAKARLEQEHLKQLVVWRSITDQQIDKIASILSSKPQTILLSIVANDPEAMFLGALLSEAFKKAKWEAVAQSSSWGNWLPVGVHIYGPEGETLSALTAAFTAAGVPFDPRPPPREPDVSIVFSGKEKVSANILIGSRIGPL